MGGTRRQGAMGWIIMTPPPPTPSPLEGGRVCTMPGREEFLSRPARARTLAHKGGGWHDANRERWMPRHHRPAGTVAAVDWRIRL